MSYFKLISWNIDFDSPFSYERARAVADLILAESPCVALLQEVSDMPFSFWQGEENGSSVSPARRESSSYKVLLRQLGQAYEPVVDLGLPSEQTYFVMAFVRRDRHRILGFEYTEFENTAQGRGLLSIQISPIASDQDIVLQIFTSHLESGANSANIRGQQMRWIASKMSLCEAPAVFAGDTNFREREAQKFHRELDEQRVQGERGLSDLYIEMGEPAHFRFTWDTRTNTNKTRDLPSRVRPRARFDRVFYTEPFRANAIRLIGRERLAVSVFPSDHYGIYGELRF
jgi:endonuclease/exonuclease/phosphatase family metal-dependent hydrolase